MVCVTGDVCKLLAFVGAAFGGLALPMAAPAFDYTWLGGSGLFSDSLKWSPEGVPAAGDRAKFSTATDATVTWTGDVSNNEMQLVQTSGSRLVLDLGGYTYTLTNRFLFDGTKAGTDVVVTNGFLTAPTNICEMKINAGVAPARMTFESGATVSLDKFTSWRSEVNVQTGAVVTFNNECKIGDGAANSLNTLNVNGGAVNANYRFFLPNNGGANSTSALNIAAGKMTVKSYFSVGDKGWGTTWGIVNLTGGELETQGEIWIGNSDGGIGIFNVSDGKWTAKNNNLEVGHRSSAVGFLNMRGGVVDVATAGKYLSVANAGGTIACDTGTVDLVGGSILVTNTGGAVLVGYGSNCLGRCFVGGSGTIDTRSFKLGSAAFAAGECVMTGGLIRAIDSVVIGDAGKGSGWMRVAGGALSNLLGSTYIGNNGGSAGALELAGGAFWTSNTLAVGNNAGATGSVTVTGGELYAIYGNIGSSGVGSLGLSNGAFRTKLDLTAGVNGTGTIVIAGGVCSAMNGVVSVGKNRNSQGLLLMTDGTLYASNSIRVGDSGGVGVFALSGGYAESGQGANASIGNVSGSTGLVSVTGGRLLYGKGVYVGNSSGYGTNTQGRLEVSGGAVVVSNELVAGNNQYTRGELAVSGGSLWVGDDIRLGVASNTFGGLTVSGGVVTNADYLDVGHYGTGVLHVAGGVLVTKVLRLTPYGYTNGAPVAEVIVSGGLLHVTNIFYCADATFSTSKVTLAGGTFKLPQLWNNRGTTLVRCDGGELEATRTDANFINTSVQVLELTANGLFVDSAGFDVATSRNLPDAAGEHGRLGKRGAGKFTLNTSATFTGPVLVEGGELALGAAGLLTLAGGCEVDGGALLNLSARSLDFTLPAGTVSRVDGELRLASGQTLTVASGATLGGTGAVGRVVFESGATLSRSAAAGGALLTASSCVLPAGAVIALTGYAAADLRSGIQVLSGASITAASGGVTVTLDGVPQAHVALRVSGGVLTAASYDPGTFIAIH